MSAIVAKVMNSTVGTSTVKALDTILKESDAANVEKLNTYMTTIANNAADRLYNKLKSDVRLVGSDEVIFHYTGGWKDKANDNYVLTTNGVSFSHSGTVIAKTLQYGTEDYGFEYEMTVYEDSSDGTNIAESGRIFIPEKQTAEISIAFNVTAGKKYYIELYCDDGNHNLYVDFCGSLEQFSPTATLATS